MTTPRDELVQELAYVVGKERAEHLADGFAHQLAEEIRTTDLPEIHVDMFDNGTQWAADLIDPEVRR